MHSKKFLHDESWTMIILEEVTFELGWYQDTKQSPLGTFGMKLVKIPYPVEGTKAGLADVLLVPRYLKDVTDKYSWLAVC